MEAEKRVIENERRERRLFEHLAASSESGVSIRARVDERLRDYNAQRNHPFHVAFSVGAAVIDGETTQSIEEQLAIADHAMYEHKRRKGDGAWKIRRRTTGGGPRRKSERRRH